MAGLDDLLSEGSGGGDNAIHGENIAGGTPNGDLTHAARDSLSGNWLLAIVGSVLYIVAINCFALFAGAYAFYIGMIKDLGNEPDLPLIINVVNGSINTIMFLFEGAIAVGFSSFFLGIVHDNEAHLNDLFTGFRCFWTSFATMLLKNIVVILWTLLLIIPGIIAAFRYSMVYLVIADDPEAGPLDAMKRSSKMMAGNKWKLFCLYCRFIGWSLLCSLTGGIGYLWLVPYMQTAKAEFYEDVKWNQFS